MVEKEYDKYSLSISIGLHLGQTCNYLPEDQEKNVIGNLLMPIIYLVELGMMSPDECWKTVKLYNEIVEENDNFGGVLKPKSRKWFDQACKQAGPNSDL